MLFCNHEWIKQTNEPIADYFDYDGWHVGVFVCKCSKCGKIKKRKYLDNHQVGQLFS